MALPEFGSDCAGNMSRRFNRIAGAEIDGEVNLEWTRITFPLRTQGGCTFNKVIILRNSQIYLLELADTSIRDLRAAALVVERSVLLHDGFVAYGGVNFEGVTIGGHLFCEGAQFISENDTSPALNFDEAVINGSVSLTRGFKAEGEVTLRRGKITGTLNCDGGQFESKAAKLSLNAGGAQIGGFAFLRDGF